MTDAQHFGIRSDIYFATAAILFAAATIVFVWRPWAAASTGIMAVLCWWNGYQFAAAAIAALKAKPSQGTDQAQEAK